MWPPDINVCVIRCFQLVLFHVTSHGAQVLRVTKDLSTIKALVTLMRSESERCNDDTAFVFSSRVNE